MPIIDVPPSSVPGLCSYRTTLAHHSHMHLPSSVPGRSSVPGLCSYRTTLEHHSHTHPPSSVPGRGAPEARATAEALLLSEVVLKAGAGVVLLKAAFTSRKAMRRSMCTMP
eukprot:1162024-Pelagomonas_calceolata.AAC.3